MGMPLPVCADASRPGEVDRTAVSERIVDKNAVNRRGVECTGAALVKFTICAFRNLVVDQQIVLVLIDMQPMRSPRFRQNLQPCECRWKNRRRCSRRQSSTRQSLPALH